MGWVQVYPDALGLPRVLFFILFFNFLYLFEEGEAGRGIQCEA